MTASSSGSLAAPQASTGGGLRPRRSVDRFDVISDLGLDVVRIFLLWDDWQPSPTG